VSQNDREVPQWHMTRRKLGRILRAGVDNQLQVSEDRCCESRALAATLVKMIDEYALHAGQAHMLRFAALGEVLR